MRMQGEHRDYQDPQPTDQITIDGKIVQDVCQKYSAPRKSEILNQFIGSCELHKESVSYTLNEKDHRENVMYHTVKSEPNLILLTANITHLGNTWPSYKYRIQIPPKWRAFEAAHRDKDVRFIGIYHYGDNVIFADFNKQNYIRAKSKNSSAHIMIFDLFQGMKLGYYSKTDQKNNHITVIESSNFKDYLYSGTTEVSDALGYVKQMNLDFPFNTTIYGKDAYKEMWDADFKGKKEGEWPGFWVEFFYERYIRDHGLTPIIEYFGRKKRDGFEFDLFAHCDDCFIDVKSSNVTQSLFHGNKIDYTLDAIRKYGKIWYVLYNFESEKDSKHNNEVARYWSGLMGKPLKPNGSCSYGKRMKYSVKFVSMQIIQFDASNISILKTIKESGGREKFGAKKKDLENCTLYTYKPLSDA